MSAQDRATTSELAAEFELAIGSLASRPLIDYSMLEIAEDIRFLGSVIEAQIERNHPESSATLTRIAAIALEGAARLRRQQ